jgi:hypothetical protein
VTELADTFQEEFLDEEIWGGWPTCPHHGTHPLEPRLGSESIAAWFGPAERWCRRSVAWLHDHLT